MSAAKWRVRGFELDRRLGAGASSEVWRATVVSSGDVVALKRLPLSGGEQAQRAVAEAAKLRVLDHPHLVRLHDLVLQRDAAVLVLDLADAGSLADLLSVRGRLTPGEAITALAPVAAALAHVHAAGVVHGDVSPANVLFTRGGVPLLADLGVARLTGDATDAESTPAYVDPLVARGGVPTSHSDVFMLGALALHVFTGAPLWTARTGDAALAQACSGGLGHVEGRLAVADLPPAMAAVVRRALTLDPGRRGSAADFALDLRHSGQPVAVELAAGRARVATRTSPAVDPAAGTGGQPGPPRSPAVRAVPVRRRDEPRHDDPVPAPASLTRPRRPDATPPAAASRTRASAPGPSAPGAGSGDVRGVPRAGGRHAAVPARRSRRPESVSTTPALERARQILSGRARPFGAPTGARESIGESSEWGSGTSPAGDAARPHFTRPTAPLADGRAEPGRAEPGRAGPEVVVGRPAPTSAVRRVRPTLPAARRRVTGRSAAVGSGAVVLAAAGVLGAVLVGHGRSDASATPVAGGGPVGPTAHSTAATSRPTTVPARSSSPAASRPAASRPGTSPPPTTRRARVRPTAGGTVAPTPQDWAVVLRRLDNLRQRAFATRDVDLLDQVYVAGPLRAADSASLRRLVPVGCGLVGVRTDYRDVAAGASDPGSGPVTITARVTLPPSHLVCAGRGMRAVSGLGPARVRVTLIRRGGTTLIASERTLA